MEQNLTQNDISVKQLPSQTNRKKNMEELTQMMATLTSLAPRVGPHIFPKATIDSSMESLVGEEEQEEAVLLAVEEFMEGSGVEQCSVCKGDGELSPVVKTSIDISSRTVQLSGVEVCVLDTPLTMICTILTLASHRQCM